MLIFGKPRKALDHNCDIFCSNRGGHLGEMKIVKLRWTNSAGHECKAGPARYCQRARDFAQAGGEEVEEVS